MVIVLLTQENYEKYTKSVTDGFAALCAIDKTTSLLVIAGDRVSMAIYKCSERILEKRKYLESVYRGENHKDMMADFRKERQMVAQEFLDIYNKSYLGWTIWQSTINDAKLANGQ